MEEYCMLATGMQLAMYFTEEMSIVPSMLSRLKARSGVWSPGMMLIICTKLALWLVLLVVVVKGVDLPPHFCLQFAFNLLCTVCNGPNGQVTY